MSAPLPSPSFPVPRPSRVVPTVGPQLLGAERADQAEMILARVAHATNLAGMARNRGIAVPSEFDAQVTALRDALLAGLGLRFDPAPTAETMLAAGYALTFESVNSAPTAEVNS